MANNTITVGQVLKIEKDTTPATYTVKKGDTLSDISKEFGVSVLDILKFNDLTSADLQIGQVLKLIPDVQVTEDEVVIMPIYEEYTVKSGDSLYSIAKKYDVTAEELKGYNNLTNNMLSIGQILKVKVGEEIVGVEECYGEGFENVPKNYITHIVKKDDNLYSIAEDYHTSVDQIKKLNNLTSNNLEIGQVLKIKEVK